MLLKGVKPDRGVKIITIEDHQIICDGITYQLATTGGSLVTRINEETGQTEIRLLAWRADGAAHPQAEPAPPEDGLRNSARVRILRRDSTNNALWVPENTEVIEDVTFSQYWNFTENAPWKKPSS